MCENETKAKLIIRHMYRYKYPCFVRKRVYLGEKKTRLTIRQDSSLYAHVMCGKRSLCPNILPSNGKLENIWRV